MTIAFIGSVALNRLPGFQRKPKDIDIIGTYDDVISYMKSFDVGAIYPISDGKKMVMKSKDGIIVEAEIAWPGSISEQLLNLIKSDQESLVFENEYIYPSIDVLYMLKMSHRYLKNSPHFNKTMQDIHAMRRMGAKIKPEHEEFYMTRINATYDYKHPSLKRNKDNFFADDNIQYIYDHDTIHLSVMVKDQPAYMNFKDEDHEVWCSKEKFFTCDEETRLNAVLEESLVLALERSQIPFPNTDKIKSFEIALMKVCTSITSGWFREYAWEHYYEVIEMFNKEHLNYVSKFWNDVEIGLIKLLGNK